MNNIPPNDKKVRTRDEELFEANSANDLLWNELREEHSASDKKGAIASLLKKTLISCILLTLCSFSLTFVLPEETRGAGNRFFRSIVTGIKGTRQNIPETMVADGILAVKLAEAVDRAPFALRFPTYLPYQAKLSEVVLFDDTVFGVKYLFTSPGTSIVILQRDVQETMVSLVLDDYSENEGREVYIFSSPGLIFADNDETLFLSFVDELGIHFIISGKINDEEIIKIAYSLKS